MSGSSLSRLPTPYQSFDGWVMSDAAAYLVLGCLVCFWCLSLLNEFGMLSTRTLFHSHRMDLGIYHTLARRAGALIFGSSFGHWVGLRYCYMMTTTFGNKKKSIFSIYLFLQTHGPPRLAHGVRPLTDAQTHITKKVASFPRRWILTMFILLLDILMVLIDDFLRGSDLFLPGLPDYLTRAGRCQLRL